MHNLLGIKILCNQSQLILIVRHDSVTTFDFERLLIRIYSPCTVSNWYANMGQNVPKTDACWPAVSRPEPFSSRRPACLTSYHSPSSCLGTKTDDPARCSPAQENICAQIFQLFSAVNLDIYKQQGLNSVSPSIFRYRNIISITKTNLLVVSFMV